MTKLAVVVSCAVFQVFPLSQTDRFSSRDGFCDVTNHAGHDHPKSAMHDFVLKLVVTDLKSVDQLFGNSLRSNHKSLQILITLFTFHLQLEIQSLRPL